MISHAARNPKRAALMFLLTLGCADATAGGLSTAWRGERSIVGDSTLVRTHAGTLQGDLGTISGASIEPVYAGDGIQRSTILDYTESGLWIGESSQLVVISIAGLVDTIGRRGDGPGEFRLVRGLRVRGDTIIVLDANANRLTRLTPTEAPSPATVEAPAGYADLRAADLGTCRGTLLVVWGRGMVARGGPPDTVAAVWWKPGALPEPWLFLEDVSWTETAVPGTRRPFGPRALLANDGGCRVASSDGVAYSVRVSDAATGKITRITVDEAAPAVTDAAKTIPEGWREEFPNALLSPLLDLMQAQEYGTTRNQVEDLQFDDGGRLWVRVVDSTYKYHPFVMARVEAARPPAYRWDVFDKEGRRLAVVRLPSNFSPKAWGGQWVYGIAENEDGALVVGRLPIPKELE